MNIFAIITKLNFSIILTKMTKMTKDSTKKSRKASPKIIKKHRENTETKFYIYNFWNGKRTWPKRVSDNVIYLDGKKRAGLFYGRAKFEFSDFTYEGEIKASKCDGFGKITSKKIHGISYKGTFKNGFYHGLGTIFWPDVFSYKGNFQEGEFNGYGEFIHIQNNVIYEGNFDNGKYHGYGKFKFANSDIYIGQFEFSVIKGHGKLIYSSGNITESTFDTTLDENGNSEKYILNGETKFKFKSGVEIIANLNLDNSYLKLPDNTIIEGSFEIKDDDADNDLVDSNKIEIEIDMYQDINLKLNGNGKIIYSNGNVYDGSFSGDIAHGIKYHGNGKLILSDGTVFEGRFSQGNYYNGKLILPDGTVFEGGFSQGNYYNGKLILPDGTVYEGRFSEGKYHENGKLILPDGTVYEGGFSEGKYHGNGKLILSDGTVYEGGWICGERIMDFIALEDTDNYYIKEIFTGKQTSTSHRIYFDKISQKKYSQLYTHDNLIYSFELLSNIDDNDIHQLITKQVGFDILNNSDFSEEQLENIMCPISYSPMIFPIQLSCGHTFCETSLSRVFFSTNSYVCALCRRKAINFATNSKIKELSEKCIFGFNGKKIEIQDIKNYLHLIMMSHNMNKKR
jgi:hypothetical protein